MTKMTTRRASFSMRGQALSASTHINFTIIKPPTDASYHHWQPGAIDEVSQVAMAVTENAMAMVLRQDRFSVLRKALFITTLQ